jgi:hypothetical protein
MVEFFLRFAGAPVQDGTSSKVAVWIDEKSGEMKVVIVKSVIVKFC